MSHQDLFERNMAVFAGQFPDVHARLQSVRSTLSSLVFDGDNVVDLDLGSGRLYRRDGRLVAREQFEAFSRSPSQIGYLLPDPNRLDSMISRRLHAELTEAIDRRGVNVMPLVTSTHTGFFFIFGVALGYHLKPLLERIDTPHVVISEAFEEFLLASMRVVDWGELVELCQARGTKLHLCCGRTPDVLQAQIRTLIDGEGPVLLDGSYFFQHYSLWAFQETKRRLINDMPLQMTARGYFEDERKMVRNAATNLHKFNYHILTGGYRQRSHIPVFVIGAGPSIDQAIPFIKEWRDQAIVFSAGSGLQPCLANDIYPDFHIELENTYYIYNKIRFILDRNLDKFPSGKFDGINFIASATVNPAVTPMFEDTYYFFRESSTSSLTLGTEFGLHTGVAPTVSNTALSVIARLGLGTIYLFGVDCGWRDAGNHHSRDSIYYTADQFRDEHRQGAYTLPGNFGGFVQSDMVFDWCRNMLEEAIAAFHLDVYNCSDGALLNGATPMVPEALELPGEPLDRAALIRSIRQSCPTFAPGEFFKTRRITDYAGQLDAFGDTLFPLLDQAEAEQWPFLKFHDAFWKALGGEAAYRGLGMAAWVQYSSISILKHSCVFLNRIPDPEARQALTLDFYGMFRRAHREMLDEARAHLDQIQAWVEGGPEPEWTDGVPRVPGTTY